jgi:holo-[acyl-carrier protein] synthase
MVVGVGIDTFEVDRIEKSALSDPEILKTLFTLKEISYCESKAHKFQHYAARYAAKEAFLKAIGIGLNIGFKFIEIEVVNDESGQPFLYLHGSLKKISKKKKISNILLSLSHATDYASAVVILEK